MKLKISMVSSLAVLFLLVILSGCVTPESTSTTTPIQTETFAPMPTELSLRIGETAKLSVIEVTVISVNKTDIISISPQLTDETEKGKLFVLADVEIKNTGNKGVKFTVNPFTMTDLAGFRQFQVYYNHEDKFETGDLYPNNTRRGKVLFKVPIEAKGLKIELDLDDLYTPDFAPLPIKVKSVSWRLE